MSTAAEHYEHHLGPIYVWMAGGAGAALQAGSAEIEALNLPATRGAFVLDLGAGFGMHSSPLARRGARVTAIDTSVELLRTLTELRGAWTKEETIVQVHGVGPWAIAYVNPADDPRKK